MRNLQGCYEFKEWWCDYEHKQQAVMIIGSDVGDTNKELQKSRLEYKNKLRPIKIKTQCTCVKIKCFFITKQ